MKTASHRLGVGVSDRTTALRSWDVRLSEFIDDRGRSKRKPVLLFRVEIPRLPPIGVALGIPPDQGEFRLDERQGREPRLFGLVSDVGRAFPGLDGGMKSAKSLFKE